MLPGNFIGGYMKEQQLSTHMRLQRILAIVSNMTECNGYQEALHNPDDQSLYWVGPPLMSILDLAKGYGPSLDGKKRVT